MKRSIDIINNTESLNPWIKRSIELFQEDAYLDKINEVYPFVVAIPIRLSDELKRKIKLKYTARETKELLELITSLNKFPYDDPVWYLLKEIKDCLRKNPNQIERIAESLYNLTSEEIIFQLESPPKINQQIGPMFNSWLKMKFNTLPLSEFKEINDGVFILDATEEECKQFVITTLGQNIDKRPDIVAKVNTQYIIGEAKWIGQPGGNQEKQVQEVLKFCKNQRGIIKRIGIVDGFPWAIYKKNNKIINNKEAVYIQESEYDIFSSLLLIEYFENL